MSSTLEEELEVAAAAVDVPFGDLDAVVRRAHDRVGRRRRVAMTVMAFWVAGMVVAGVSIAGRDSSSTLPAGEPKPQVSVHLDPKRPTRAGLLDLYDDPGPVFPRVDRVEVKKTTWGDVRAVLRQDHYDEQPTTVGDDAEIVYVVVQSGLHLPYYDGRGGTMVEEYGWGAMVFAADGGRPMAFVGRRDGRSWPVFFDHLADLPGE